MGVDADLELKVVLIAERKVGRVIDRSPGEELLEKDPGKVCATGEGNTSSVGGGSTKEGSWSSGVNEGAGDGSREGCREDAREEGCEVAETSGGSALVEERVRRVVGAIEVDGTVFLYFAGWSRGQGVGRLLMKGAADGGNLKEYKGTKETWRLEKLTSPNWGSQMNVDRGVYEFLEEKRRQNEGDFAAALSTFSQGIYVQVEYSYLETETR
ncbi:hypothetical protein BGW80DRAFT_1450912 [Lactifluus volemus]|nr:hypothetical protein BGW80DRAFT_1450912 [Lactifluus volemus]